MSHYYFLQRPLGRALFHSQKRHLSFSDWANGIKKSFLGLQSLPELPFLQDLFGHDPIGPPETQTIMIIISYFAFLAINYCLS